MCRTLTMIQIKPCRGDTSRDTCDPQEQASRPPETKRWEMKNARDLKAIEKLHSKMTHKEEIKDSSKYDLFNPALYDIQKRLKKMKKHK